MIDFAPCTHERHKLFGKTKSGEQRYRCLDCGKTFVQSTRMLAGMRIGLDRAAKIVHCMMEGMGVRATARLNGVAKDTVLDLLLLAGERCKVFAEQALVAVPVQELQVDELWSYVARKETTRIKLSMSNAECGDRYCYVGLERKTKLALAWHLGHRHGGDALAFVDKLSRACDGSRFQVTTDGYSPYKRLIPRFFPHADFGMLIKLFSAGQDGKYSPGQIIEVKRKPMQGEPDYDGMCTSHVERHNLTIRMQIRRFTRLTNCFSRRVANHEAALGLYFGYYNWVQRHSTIKTTPAVASGLTDHQWTTRELLEVTSGLALPA